MRALDPSGNTTRPSDNSSSRLSRNCCTLPSGHTSAHPLRPRQPSPPPVTLSSAPFPNASALPKVVVHSWPLTPAAASSSNASARPLPQHFRSPKRSISADTTAIATSAGFTVVVAISAEAVGGGVGGVVGGRIRRR